MLRIFDDDNSITRGQYTPDFCPTFSVWGSASAGMTEKNDPFYRQIWGGSLLRYIQWAFTLK